MSITVLEPSEGLRVIAIPDTEGRFKTASLTVQLLMPLSE